MGVTPYLEANAILAAQQGDTDEVQLILGEMLSNERAELRQAASTLISEIDAF